MTIDIWKITLPLLGAVLTWVFNLWRQRAKEEYLRKEPLYRDLLSAVRGFYQASGTPPITISTASPPFDPSRSAKQKFLDQVTLAWLYTPDTVILSAYAFLNMVNTDRQPPATQKEMEIALGNVVVPYVKIFSGGASLSFRELG